MTLDEFMKRREELNRRILQTRRQMDRLEQEYIDSQPYKRGDAISINGSFVGWLVDIRCEIYQWRIIYAPPRLDGSQSDKFKSAYCKHLSEISVFTL